MKYTNVVSISGFGTDLSPYQGPPSPEKDQLWTELYNCMMSAHQLTCRPEPNTDVIAVGISRIPIEDAAQLVNRTVPIPGDPGQYIIALDVFHELHCLVSRDRFFAVTPSPRMRTTLIIVSYRI